MAMTGNARGVDGFVAEEGETQVVPDMGMGQKYAIDRVSIDPVTRSGAQMGKRRQLFAQIRGGVEEIDLVDHRQDQGQTGDMSPVARIQSGHGASLTGTCRVR